MSVSIERFPEVFPRERFDKGILGMACERKRADETRSFGERKEGRRKEDAGLTIFKLRPGDNPSKFWIAMLCTALHIYHVPCLFPAGITARVLKITEENVLPLL